MKTINILLFLMMLTGCSSPPAPVSVEWDKSGESVNINLTQWNDTPLLILPQSLMGSGYCPFTQRSLTRHSGPPTYFTQLRIRRVLLLLQHQVQHSLLQQAGFASMAQKVLLNINLQLSA